MTKSELAPALQAHIRASRKSSGRHPSAEDLVAYRSEALQPEDEQRIRNHLVACQDCSDLLLDLAEFEDTGGLQDTVPDPEIERAWQQQRERLFSAPSVYRSRPVKLGGWLAAACLALVAGTLGLQLRELRRESAQLYREDLPRIVLAPQTTTRNLDDERPVLRLKPGRPGFALLLVDDNLPFESFRAEFFSPSGAVLWTREGLSPAEELLLVPVQPDLLPSGEIRIVVSGLRDGRFSRIDEYLLRVENP